MSAPSATRSPAREQMSDALFGLDGTEMPELRSDPSGRGGWQDAGGLPPLPLPAIPDPRLTQEAMAAALGVAFAEPVDQDPGAAPAPAPQLAAPASAAAASVPQANAPQATLTAPLPTQAAPPAAVPPATGEPGGRPVAAAPIPPAAPWSARTIRLRRRPPLGLPLGAPLALQPRTSGQLIAPRRRPSRQGVGLLAQNRSNGGATVFFLVAFLLVGVLAYSIILGIVGSIVRLF